MREEKDLKSPPNNDRKERQKQQKDKIECSVRKPRVLAVYPTQVS